MGQLRLEADHGHGPETELSWFALGGGRDNPPELQGTTCGYNRGPTRFFANEDIDG